MFYVYLKTTYDKPENENTMIVTGLLSLNCSVIWKRYKQMVYC